MPQPDVIYTQPSGAPQTQPSAPEEFDPNKMLMAIAQDIKTKNLNIDDLTLADAVQARIEMMSHLQPTIRQQMAQQVQAWKEAQGEARLDQGQQNIDIRKQGLQEKTQHDQQTVQLGAARIKDADMRLKTTQDAIDRRAAERGADKARTTAQRERLGALKAKLSAAKTKMAGILSGANTGDAKAASDEVNKLADQITDFQTKVMQSSSGPTAPTAKGNDPLGLR